MLMWGHRSAERSLGKDGGEGEIKQITDAENVELKLSGTVGPLFPFLDLVPSAAML